MFSSVARRATPMDSNTLQMRRSSKASRPRRSERTTQTWEKRPTRASRASARPAGRSSKGMVPRDAVILVMPEDDNTRLGTQTAGQGGALVADGMAVTLLVGGDAGISGDAANGIGQDDLQRDGKRSGMYERSGGAGRSRRIGILQERSQSVDTDPPKRRGGRHAHLERECAPPHRRQIQDLRGRRPTVGGSS